MKTKLLLFALLITANISMSLAQTGPTAPTITGVSTDSQLSVAFTAGTDGGSAITSYKYSTDGGTTWLTRQTGTTASPIVITTLSSDGTTKIVSGTSYNIQIKALNAIGDGDASATSSATYLFLGGGAGTVGNPYLIGSVNDLIAARAAAVTSPATANQTAYYQLAADINMSSAGNFNSFGSYAVPFKGNFNGNGHKVSGVISGTSSTRLSNAAIGFFGYIDGATISNLSVDVSYFTTSVPVANQGSSCGGLVCYTTGAGSIVINNCHVTGTIDALSTGSAATTLARAGGIVCNPNSSSNATITIINSTVDAIIKAQNAVTSAGSAICGGIAGELRNTAYTLNIVNCSTSGSVNAVNTYGNSYAAGIVSYFYATTPTVNVLNSLAKNTVATSGVSASGYNGTPAAGIGQVPTANCQIKYCIALNPSISGVNTVASTGTQALDRVYSGTVVPTAGNVDFNYAKSDMTVQGTVNGVGPTTISLAGKTTAGKDGADLGADPMGDATTKLNAYVSTNSPFNGIALTTWTGGGLTTLSANSQIKLLTLNYKVTNGVLNINGIEGSKQLSIYIISGALYKKITVSDSYITSLAKGIYILKVDGFAPSKLAVY